MANIRLAGERAALKPRRDPYFESMGKGLALGFRKMRSDSFGTWIARYYDAVSQKQLHHPLGDFANFPNSERYGEALKAAQSWFKHISQGGSTENLSIKDVCLRYVSYLKENNKAKTGQDVLKRFERLVFSTSLSTLDLKKLTPLHLDVWRKGIREAAALNGPRKGNPRSDSSINRDMTALRAALNKAYEDGLVTTDFAWRAKLKPIKGADGRRSLYLSMAERKLLLQNAEQDISILIRAMCLLPMRPGALASLRVRDFDKHTQTLYVGKDKAGADRKIPLPPETAAFIANLTLGKTPLAPLISRANGSSWNKDSWKITVKMAVHKAALPANTSLYTLRHSAITDLVHHGLDTLTVAQLSGTSLLMIEKHYGHLKQTHARAALALLNID